MGIAAYLAGWCLIGEYHLKLEGQTLKQIFMSSFSFLPKEDPESTLLELIYSRVDILPCYLTAIAPHFHTQLCTLLTALAPKLLGTLGSYFHSGLFSPEACL